MAKQKKNIESAEEHAETWLMRQIDRGRWQPGEKLPTLSEMCQYCSVSRVPIVYAVQRLVKKGLLRSRRGSGIFVSGTASGHKLVSQGRFQWQRVSQAIQNEIITRLHAHHAFLPSIKELMERYATSRRTIKKALIYLEEHHVVTQKGSRYFIRLGEKTRPKNSILFLCHQQLDEIGASNFSALSMSDFIRSLEGECQQRNLTLKISAFRSFREVLSILKKELTRGTIVYFPRKEITAVLEQLMPISKPFAIIDDFGAVNVTSLLSTLTHKRFTACTIDELYAGKQVGLHALVNGHRHCAFFSPFHEESFSQQRFLGIQQEFELQPHTSLISLTLNNKKVNLHIDMLNDLQKNYPFTIHKPQLTNANVAPVVLDEYLNAREFNWVLHSPLWNTQFENAYKQKLDTVLWPLFDQALSKQKCTLWIGVNDSVALSALRFLKLKATNTRKKISLIGFDNSIPASYNRLTSFDFNLSKTAHWLIDHIVSTDRSNAGTICKHQGSLMIRESVRNNQ